MGFFSKGTYVDLPWNDDFDLFLKKMSDNTDKYSGEELLHQIHRDAIEAKFISIRMMATTLRRLWVVFGIQAATIAYLILR